MFSIETILYKYFLEGKTVKSAIQTHLKARKHTFQLWQLGHKCMDLACIAQIRNHRPFVGSPSWQKTNVQAKHVQHTTVGDIDRSSKRHQFWV